MFGDGKVARMDNFKRAEVWRGGRRRTTRAPAWTRARSPSSRRSSRRSERLPDMPVTLDSLVATTACTLAVGRSIASGKVEQVAGWDRPAEDEVHVDLVAAQ